MVFVILCKLPVHLIGAGVSIETRKVRQRDRCHVFEVSDTSSIWTSFRSKGLRHGVAQVDRFAVSVGGQVDFGNIECCHHVMVFMDQIVTVELRLLLVCGP